MNHYYSLNFHSKTFSKIRITIRDSFQTRNIYFKSNGYIWWPQKCLKKKYFVFRTFVVETLETSPPSGWRWQPEVEEEAEGGKETTVRAEEEVNVAIIIWQSSSRSNVVFVGPSWLSLSYVTFLEFTIFYHILSYLIIFQCVNCSHIGKTSNLIF